MLKSFRCSDTKRLFHGERVSRFANIESAARLRLGALQAATTLRDLLARPSNRLEALKRDRIGQHSIRVNDQYRICFRWHEGNAYDVEIVDYHWEDLIMPKRLPPINPGEQVKEFMNDLGLTMNQLAKALHVPPNRITGIVNGTRGITAETSMRLARYLGTSGEMCMNLQAHYEMEVARDAFEASIRKEVKQREETAA